MQRGTTCLKLASNSELLRNKQGKASHGVSNAKVFVLIWRLMQVDSMWNQCHAYLLWLSVLAIELEMWLDSQSSLHSRLASPSGTVQSDAGRPQSALLA